jgi:hypothetical protein
MTARSPDRQVSRRIAKAAPGVARRPIKRAVRRFGVATSGLRPLPAFLVIGTHRGGTTSLQRYLDRHPCVLRNFPRAQDVKGVRYFDENFFRGVDWYRSHFATAAYRRYMGRLHGGPVLSGDASPYCLFHPAAAERASRVVPEAKIIVLLRDPIERAYSHWKRERRNGREPLERFEDAVAAEPDRLRGEVERILSDERYYSYAHENFSYISQGLYLDPLRQWLDRYPRERVFIASSERFREDPERVYLEVLEFLGLPAFPLRDAARLNADPAGRELDPELRRALSARVAPHNRRLEAYLGLELGWSP